MSLAKKFCTAFAVSACVFLTGIGVMLAVPPADPTDFNGTALSTTSILWTWQDNSGNEDGFIIQDDSTPPVIILRPQANATSALESGLAANTACTRSCLAYTWSDATALQAVSYGTFNTADQYQNIGRPVGFAFTPQNDIQITRVATVSGNQVNIHKTAGAELVLNYRFASPPDGTWVWGDLPAPMLLAAGQEYRISSWNDATPRRIWDRSFLSGGYTAQAELQLQPTKIAVWGNAPTDNYPEEYDDGPADEILGYVNFEYYSAANLEYSAPATAARYTLISTRKWDTFPDWSDFTVTPLAAGVVDIDVTNPPENKDSGLTGVKVERATNPAFTQNVVLVQDFNNAYQDILDSVPAAGTYYYRFTLRNGDGVEIAPVVTTGIICTPPLDAPVNLSGQGVSATRILWSWDAVTGAQAYMLEDGSGSLKALAWAPATSCTETVSGENVPSTCRVRACASFPDTVITVYYPTTTQAYLFMPWTSDLNYQRGQYLFTPSEMKDKPGLIKGVQWRAGSTGTGIEQYGVTVRMGHTSLSDLGGTFAGNYTEGGPTVVWNATYIPSGVTMGSWVSIPITGTFLYNGVKNLLLDIAVSSAFGDIAWIKTDSSTKTMAFGSSSGTVCGTINWKFQTKFIVDMVVGPSAPSAAAAAYSLVHSATVDDFALTNPSGMTVEITVSAPANNPGAGLTGVKVERALNADFSDSTVIQDFAPNYVVNDVVPADNVYRYRITYRNADGIASGTSAGKTITIGGGIPKVAVTVTTSPAGLLVTVDGADYTAPKTFNWTPGDGHVIAAKSPQSGGPGTQYVFQSWSDSGAQSHDITTPSSAETYTANFIIGYSLTTAADPPAGGSVAPGEVSYHAPGTVVSLSATATTGYRFLNWTGDPVADPNSPTTTITMDGPRSVTANFELCPTYILTTSANPPGSGTVTPATGPQNENSTVTLNALPASGYEFVNWTGDISTAANPATILMDSDKYVVANFTPVSVTADFSGTPASGPAPLTVSFTDASTGLVLSYLWNFGDGSESDEQNPTHVYAVPGAYTVSLAVDGAGYDSRTKVDYITVTGNAPGSDKKKGCSCSFDRREAGEPPCGWLLPAAAFVLAWLALRRRTPFISRRACPPA